MIKKYKQYNESLLDKMVGPNLQDVWVNMGGLDFFETAPKNATELLDKIVENSELKVTPHSSDYYINGELILMVKQKPIYIYVCETIEEMLLTIYHDDFEKKYYSKLTKLEKVKNFLNEYFIN